MEEITTTEIFDCFGIKTTLPAARIQSKEDLLLLIESCATMRDMVLDLIQLNEEFTNSKEDEI